MTTSDSSRLTPEDIPDGLFERCLRAIYGAPDDRPTLSALVSWHGQPDGLKAALALAYTAGRESLLREPNDIEATGRCRCNGCVGQGMCDLYDPADADERAENDAERIAEMSAEEREGYGDL